MTIAAILDVKDEDVITCAPDTQVAQAVAMLAEYRIGCLPVVEDGQVRGLFSERDLVHIIARHGAVSLDWPVAEVMTAPVISVGPETSVLAALSLMTQRRVRHLPVLREQRLAGFVSIGDLVKYRIDRIEREAAAMRDYIQSA